jgi:hypothetical protein
MKITNDIRWLASQKYGGAGLPDAEAKNAITAPRF